MTVNKDIVSKIMTFEEGEMDFEEMVEFFQELIDSGIINHLQGSYQRTAKSLLDAGYIHVKT